jgi:hypothetical protein
VIRSEHIVELRSAVQSVCDSYGDAAQMPDNALDWVNGSKQTLNVIELLELFERGLAATRRSVCSSPQLRPTPRFRTKRPHTVRSDDPDIRHSG